MAVPGDAKRPQFPLGGALMPNASVHPCRAQRAACLLLHPGLVLCPTIFFGRLQGGEDRWTQSSIQEVLLSGGNFVSSSLALSTVLLELSRCLVSMAPFLL